MQPTSPDLMEIANRVLLVDDDLDLCALTSEFLQSRGLAVVVETDGLRAVDQIVSGRFSLAVLDVMLPGIDGFEVLRRVRSSTGVASTLPIIMLTAHGGEIDRIVGLEMGADDYLSKPFNPRELLARIRAILRRSETANASAARPDEVETSDSATASPWSSPASGHPETSPEQATSRNDIAAAGNDQNDGRLVCGDVVMDVSCRTVWRNEGEIELTAAEFDLLKVLLQRTGTVVSREELSSQVLQRRLLPFDRSLDVHMSKLRRKLGPPDYIRTIRGIGYILSRPAIRHS